jgi:hypothetical protein
LAFLRVARSLAINFDMLAARVFESRQLICGNKPATWFSRSFSEPIVFFCASLLDQRKKGLYGPCFDTGQCACAFKQVRKIKRFDRDRWNGSR